MHSQAKMQGYDAIIVGARCAGAATAMLLARQGLRVLMIDRASPGTDTLSTHAFMRAGVVQLARWGLLDGLMATGAPLSRTTTLHYGATPIVVDVKPDHGVEGLIAPRRTVLDKLLVDAAREAGVEVRYNVSLMELLRDAQGRVRGVIVESARGIRELHTAHIVVGADGRKSTVARMVAARCIERGKHASAFVYGYYSGVQLSGYHWFYDSGVAAGAVPTHGDQHCVFASLPANLEPRRLPDLLARRFDDVITAASPMLAEQLSGARRQGPFRAFSGAPGHLKQSRGPGWALVGDAAFYKDPISAHGMTAALRDAELLAAEIVVGSVSDDRDVSSPRVRLSLDQLRLIDAVASYRWNLGGLQELHLRFSETMRAELRLLTQVDLPQQQAA